MHFSQWLSPSVVTNNSTFSFGHRSFFAIFRDLSVDQCWLNIIDVPLVVYLVRVRDGAVAVKAPVPLQVRVEDRLPAQPGHAGLGHGGATLGEGRGGASFASRERDVWNLQWV